MTTAYYSTVLDHSAETVWSLIRDFNNYPVYIEGVTESVIEDDRPGDEVGAVRRFNYRGQWIRQRLGAHSDEARSLTYVGLDPFAFPQGKRVDTPSPARYQGTMHVIPVVDGGRCFLEWSVDLDTAPQEAEAWRGLFAGMIPAWAESLRGTLRRLAPQDW